MNQKMVNGIIRAVLAAIGGVVVGSGHMNESDWAQISGAVIVLVAAVWSVIEKRSGQPPVSGGGVPFSVALLGICLLASGCATSANDVAMAQVAANTAVSYYNQPNTAETMVLEGPNLTWTIQGATKITMTAPIPPKSVYPRDQGTLQTLLSGGADIAKTAVYGVLGYQGIKAMQAVATTEPTVVTTEKLVPVSGATE